MRYEFVDNKIKVAVNDRLRDYNDLVTNVWDYLEQAGFSFHGTVREWSAVFFRQTYFVLHHFLKDRPDSECIPQDSNLKWSDIVERDTDAGAFFSFLEEADFQLYIPVQAMIDAMIDDGQNWHYQSPKHKFQMYCFHPTCVLLVEMYLQNKVPPYGAQEEPVPFPKDRFQPFLDFFVEPVETTKRDRVRVIEGETLDILEKVDEDLLDVTRARIKKIYDDHSRIGLLMSGGKDSRTVTQLMIEHAIQNPDPSKNIMIITSDTLVENQGVKAGILDLRKALAEALPWVEFHIVEPREDNTLLVCIIGKGYQSIQNSYYSTARLRVASVLLELQSLTTMRR